MVGSKTSDMTAVLSWEHTEICLSQGWWMSSGVAAAGSLKVGGHLERAAVGCGMHNLACLKRFESNSVSYSLGKGMATHSEIITCGRIMDLAEGATVDSRFLKEVLKWVAKMVLKLKT